VWVRPEPNKWVRGAQYPFVVLGKSHPGHKKNSTPKEDPPLEEKCKPQNAKFR